MRTRTRLGWRPGDVPLSRLARYIDQWPCAAEYGTTPPSAARGVEPFASFLSAYAREPA